LAFVLWHAWALRRVTTTDDVTVRTDALVASR
jgi:hypothetical protein